MRGALRPRGRAACRSTPGLAGASRRGGAGRPGRGRGGGAAVLVRPPGARGARWPRRCAQALPGVHVSASSEVLPEIREYERISTTAVDAYLTPRAAPLPGAAGASARPTPGLPAPAIMQSSGGVLPIEDSAEHAAWTVLSGPAGGVIGAARLAAERGRAAGADLRHGRHLVRRRPGPRRGAGPHQRARSSPATPCTCRCSTWRRSRPAAAASPGLTRAAPCAWARTRRARGPARRPTALAAPSRRSPTPTSCSGVCRPTRPLGGAHRLDADAAGPRSWATWPELGLGLEECARGHRRPWPCRRWCGRCGW